MKLSIIISNRNDVIPLIITLNSLHEALKSVPYDCEIVLADNSDKRFWKVIRSTFSEILRAIKVSHDSKPCFTRARMKAASESKGEYLFCIDSHVLIGNNVLNDSIEFMDLHKDEPLGFGHPPMRWAKSGFGRLKQASELTSEGGIYNIRLDEGHRTKSEKILWALMPWICKREWYLNTLKGYGAHAEHGVSWGGAELLQQIKGWMLGYENWYIHTDPIIHLSPYTDQIYRLGKTTHRPYKTSGKFPRGFGVILALYILGGEEEGLKQFNLAKYNLRRIHKIDPDKLWPIAKELGKDEHEWLMANKKYSLSELLTIKPWRH